MAKRNIILWVIAGMAGVGILLALLLDASAWGQVLSFYTGALVPLALGIEALVAGNVALDKWRGTSATVKRK